MTRLLVVLTALAAFAIPVPLHALPATAGASTSAAMSEAGRAPADGWLAVRLRARIVAANVGSVPDRVRPRPERLRLRCAGGMADGDPQIRCAWTSSRHPAFAAYVLWRADGETRPEVVHRTADRRATGYRDSDVRPGVRYTYVVQVVDGDGRVIGRSNRARAGVRPAETRPQSRPEARPESRPGEARPEATRPEETRPEATRPEATRPEATRPEATRPEATRPEATRPEQRPEHDQELLRLDCEGAARDGTVMVVCRWSTSAHPDFAGYRVLRAADDGRAVAVHRTSDRSATAFRDADVRPGVVYTYVVQVVARDGAVLGHSNRSRAGVRPATHPEDAADPEDPADPHERERTLP